MDSFSYRVFQLINEKGMVEFLDQMIGKIEKSVLFAVDLGIYHHSPVLLVSLGLLYELP